MRTLDHANILTIPLSALPTPTTNLSGWLTTVVVEFPPLAPALARTPPPVIVGCSACSQSRVGACSKHGGLSEAEKRAARKAERRLLTQVIINR